MSITFTKEEIETIQQYNKLIERNKAENNLLYGKINQIYRDKEKEKGK